MRRIKDVLYFRQDIAPFLVHLTRERNNVSAATHLRTILRNMTLIPGDTILDAQYGRDMNVMRDPRNNPELYTAICFTETPISEAHCLLEIQGRVCNLSRYGLIFLKENLRAQNVSPVLYINNSNGDQDDIFYALNDISNNDVKRKLLPLLAVFGRKVPLRGNTRSPGDPDFTWEREWRRPRVYGNLRFRQRDVFIGLCPEDEIQKFETEFPWLKFIDPKQNMKWFADKLIASRTRCQNNNPGLDLSHSVV